jgi:hypothetical protein
MKNILTRPILIFLIAAGNWYCTANAQDRNAYHFIEPNASFSYDSNVYKLTEVRTSMRLDKNSYDFTLKDKKLGRTRILLRTEFSDLEPTQARQDSIIKEIDKHFTKTVAADETIVKVMEKKNLTLHGFSCLGISGVEPGTKRNSSTVIAVRLFKTGLTFLTLVSDDATELDKNLEIVKNLLAGYKSYTREEMEKEEEAIKKKYTVMVDSTALTTVEKTYKRSTYAGIVRLSPKSENRIYGAMLGNQLYSEETDAVKNNEVRISVTDREPGKFTHYGSLIVLNSFGKRVWMPFTITYTNTKND